MFYTHSGYTEQIFEAQSVCYHNLEFTRFNYLFLKSFNVIVTQNQIEVIKMFNKFLPCILVIATFICISVSCTPVRQSVSSETFSSSASWSTFNKFWNMILGNENYLPNQQPIWRTKLFNPYHHDIWIKLWKYVFDICFYNVHCT